MGSLKDDNPDLSPGVADSPKLLPADDSGWGKWWVCALLLLASTINYMDRQTLSVTNDRIMREFDIKEDKLGVVEAFFGYGFAAGSITFGLLADRMSVRILYPTVLLLWSVMGVFTGFARDYDDLFWCRLLLGFFEGGHWPCALKTTQLLLTPNDRMLGNSVLQSGTSIGAVATPLLMQFLLTEETGSWRPIFQGIGAIGVLWIFFWILSMPWLPNATVAEVDNAKKKFDEEEPWWQMFTMRRYWILAFVVVAINLTWHLLRFWMKLFLVTGRGYEEAAALTFIMIYYIATDVGCLGGGAVSRWLHAQGSTVFQARLVVFGVAAVLCLSSLAIPWLPQGYLLLAVMIVLGMAALALFPCYYSLAQDVSSRHQGLVTGSLGMIAWLGSSPFHPILGEYLKHTKSYDLGFALVGIPPIFALAALWFFWDQDPPGEEKGAVDLH